jgi:hypothetical protein
MSIQKNLLEIQSKLSEDVVLIAVSKTKPISALEEAYRAGQRVFGENKVQEMVEKWQALPKDIHWHMIGHVQRNKIKYMAEFVELIHGVDSIKTLKEINKQALKHNRKISVLLQVKIAREESKFGIPLEELEDFMSNLNTLELDNINFQGFMGMASNDPSQEIVREEFSILKQLYDQYKKEITTFEYLSMGMSGDYLLALDQGSNMIRVGSAIFGLRNYSI